MIDWLDKHLVPEWRKAWKRWSVQFAALAASGVGAAISQPNVLFTVLNYLPADPVQRAAAAIAIALFVFFAPSILVLLRQPKLEKTDG